MDRKQQLLEIAGGMHAIVWEQLRAKFPKLKACRVPLAEINRRLLTTGGRAWYENVPQKCDYSFELFDEYPKEYAAFIIPHELAHCACWLIFRESGHGEAWKHVMRAIGQEPSTTHNLVSRRMLARALAKTGKK